MSSLIISRRAALAAGAATLGSAIIAPVSRAQAGRVAKIGIVQSTTGGSAALYGIPEKQAIELAFAEINAAAGPTDIKLQGLHEDDGADRGQTVNIYQRLIRQDKVVAILGPTLSNSAFAADPIAQSAGIPVIASSNTAPNLTKIGNFIFRTSVPEDLVFPAVLDYAVKHHGVKKVAFIYGLDDALTRGAFDVEKKAVADQKLAVTGTESYQHGDVDFSAQLTKLRDGSPDAILLGCLAEEAAAIIRQARQLGFEKTVFVGCNATISNKLFELAGPAANGTIVGSSWYAGLDTPRSKAFVAAYRARYSGATPDIYAAQAYDGATILAAAIKAADTATDGKLIRDKLAATTNFEGVMGRFGWTAEREAAIQPKVLVSDGPNFVPAPAV